MMQHFNTEFTAKDEDKYIFFFSKLHKSWRKGQASPAVTYFAFMYRRNIEYINRSKLWRESNHEKQLLLSSIRPHNTVVSRTISGWLKKILKQAGINTDLFKAHSTRSSKAKMGRAPLVEFLKKSIMVSSFYLAKGFIISILFRRVMYFNIWCTMNQTKITGGWRTRLYSVKRVEAWRIQCQITEIFEINFLIT